MSNVNSFIIYDVIGMEDVGVVEAESLNQIYKALQLASGLSFPDVLQTYSVWRVDKHADQSTVP